MFNREFTHSKLKDRIFDIAFYIFLIEGWTMDDSLKATLVYLLEKRVNEPFVASISGDAVPSYDNDSRVIIVKNITDFFLNNEVCNRFYILYSDVETSEIENSISENDTFHIIPGIKEFFKSVMDIQAWIDEEHKKTYVYINDFTTKKYHLMQCAIPRLLPFYFKEMPLTEDEIDFLKTLTISSHVEYFERITTWLNNYDFSKYEIEGYLSGLTLKFFQNRKLELENEVRRIIGKIDEYYDCIAQYSTTLRNTNDILTTTMGKIATNEGDRELIDFFKSSKNLKILPSDTTRLCFIAKGYLDSYDPDMYETYINNKSSYFYTSRTSSFWKCGHSPNFAKIKRFFDHIFGEDADARIKICAQYNLMLDRAAVEACQSTDPSVCDRLSNPHIKYHRCLGDHRRYIVDRMLELDYIGAITQCLLSVSSINISEGVTAYHLVEELLTMNEIDDCKCIEYNGESYTPIEFYKNIIGE